MLNSINNLRLVAELCQTGQRLPETLAAWLAKSLRAYLENPSTSLNEAFGLLNARGGVPWRVEERIRRRDAALRALCERQFGDLNLSAQVREIHRMSIRYAASGWRFDGEREQVPDHYCETPKELLWLAFKSGATMPLGIRQLRNILSTLQSRNSGKPEQRSLGPRTGRSGCAVSFVDQKGRQQGLDFQGCSIR